MEVFFYIVPSIMISVALVGITAVVRKALWINRAWSGAMAEGRCLRMFTTTRGGSGDSSVSTTLHHVYEFTTRDGRAVRFEEENGPATVLEGDITTVWYIPDRPERATAQAPARGRLMAGTGCALVFLGGFATGLVAVMVQFSRHF
ncbi:DUF3592 domain-containing protein [Streptomyces griseosporeus]|uniref:DUF3592 domain-containing protein n=1 Tax=Streptomyces griseosporeus TaxID=1910 RepID=UPI00167EB42C|nr:DUF3592 domain-containing protein [Streptomyces griseosporeus]GHF37699.1 hypothetical protein GCM10018783_02610 [Streptomyces griseosporeus]